jgi:Fur family peroxide stress response transcriptional regulator
MKQLGRDIGSLGLTKQRQCVLRVIQESEKHLTAGEVFEEARGLLPGISFATVYNSLRFLKNEGFIGELKLGRDAHRYDRNLARHDHAVCNSCGTIVDLNLALPGRVLEKATELSNFEPESIELTLRGRCPECKVTK